MASNASVRARAFSAGDSSAGRRQRDALAAQYEPATFLAGDDDRDPLSWLRALNRTYAEMNIYQQLINALWILFIAYWALAAFGAKRSIGARAWRRGIGLRLAVIVVIALVFRNPALRSALRNAQTDVSGNAFMGMVGLVLCALGIALAIWARVHLGRNWGMPMSRKEDPELVTSGPYAFVRHPIYTGILLAILGSTIGVSVFWALPFVLTAGYFIYSARREEEVLLTQFPEQYSAYMKRSNMLLPWPFGSARTTVRN